MAEVRIIRSFSADMLVRIAGLYISAKWLTPGDDTSFLLPALRGSCLVAGAFDEENNIIGIARVLSDGCSDAYIQDVVVAPEFRGQGIGGQLLKTLTAELKKMGVDWIGLVGEPGTEKFYSRQGWQAKKGFTLWQLENL